MIFEIFKTFLISGTLVALISYISNKSTKIGALFYSFPTQFLISVFLIYFNQNNNNSLVKNFIKNTIFSIIIIIVILIILYYLNNNKTKKQKRIKND